MLKHTFALILALAASVAAAENERIGANGMRLTMYESAGLAICSLTYQGTEMIDGYDHGRCLQSAVSFDGRGEGFNPTEAGSYEDGLLPNKSTSVLVAKVTDRRHAATEVEMAFWQGGRSGHIHRKWVTAGWGGKSIVEHKIAFEIPAGETHALGQFEILTGYMPPAFSKFLVWNAGTGTTAPLTDGPGEQSLPVIFCTPYETLCMGAYSPQVLTGGGYGRWRFNGANCMTKAGATGCVKWNMVSRANSPRGTYRFTVYTTVGTLTEVKENLTLIRETFQ
jgi:hypothetical protein